MNRNARWQALVGVLAIALCAVVMRPWVESGILDDWGYVKMAQVLASSRHLAYNGDESAMVGWQLVLGAAAAKLFGFSFTAVRAPVALLAMGCAFLLQRIFVRAGINAWNSVVGTLGFVLSPLFLPLAFSFMTDVPGVFAELCGVYSALRALQSRSARTACGWLAVAAFAGLAGGTGRQVLWLGCMVLVPSAGWLLRHRRGVVSFTAGLWVVCAASIAGCLHWFARQPYSLVLDPLPFDFKRSELLLVGYSLVVMVSQLAFFTLPFLLPFARFLWVRSRSSAMAVGAGAVFFALFAGSLVRHHDWDRWVIPAKFGFVTMRGTMDGLPIFGERPVVVPMAVRVLITAGMVAGVLGLAAFVADGRRVKTTQPEEGPYPAVTDRQLGALLVPFTLCYLLLILARFRYQVFERYQLLTIPLVLLALIRLWQFRISPRLPAATVGILGVLVGLSVAATRDGYAMFRGRLAAAQELRDAGVPRDRIDGGFEYDGWTQIEEEGFVNYPEVRLPPGVVRPVASAQSGSCRAAYLGLFPAVVPQYALSFDPGSCAGAAPFPAASYTAWLGPHRVPIYIVRTTASSGNPAGPNSNLTGPDGNPTAPIRKTTAFDSPSRRHTPL